MNSQADFAAWSALTANIRQGAESAADGAVHAVGQHAGLQKLDSAAAQSAEREAQCRLLRDIFSPFQKASVEITWRNRTVWSLARAIYDTRDFGRMPILGDALEEAGCDRRPILEHCRSADHARGCWVIELVLTAPMGDR